MKTSFLEYYKTILERVSFDRNLFTKEYGKALRLLTDEETAELQRWLRSKGHDHAIPRMIERATTSLPGST